MSNGGVRFDSGATFQISNGVIYGDNEGECSNTASGGSAALFNQGTAQHGTFNPAGAFSSLGNLTFTDSTIRVVDGVLQ